MSMRPGQRLMVVGACDSRHWVSRSNASLSCRATSGLAVAEPSAAASTSVGIGPESQSATSRQKPLSCHDEPRRSLTSSQVAGPRVPWRVLATRRDRARRAVRIRLACLAPLAVDDASTPRRARTTRRVTQTRPSLDSAAWSLLILKASFRLAFAPGRGLGHREMAHPGSSIRAKSSDGDVENW